MKVCTWISRDYKMEGRCGNMFLSRFLCWILTFLVLCGNGAAKKDTQPVAYACENSDLLMECKEGEVIRVLRANYGRFSMKLCNPHGKTSGWNVGCHSPDSKGIIARRCKEEWISKCSNLPEDFFTSTTSCLNSVPLDIEAECDENCVAPTTTTSKPFFTRKPGSPMVPHIKYGAPDPPIITSATSLSPTKIEIKWTQKPPHETVMTTMIFYKEKDNRAEKSGYAGSNATSFVLNELTPNTLYTIYLKSINTHGLSLPSDSVTVTTRQEVIKSTLSSTSLASTNMKTTFSPSTILTSKRMSPSLPVVSALTTPVHSSKTLIYRSSLPLHTMSPPLIPTKQTKQKQMATTPQNKHTQTSTTPQNKHKQMTTAPQNKHTGTQMTKTPQNKHTQTSTTPQNKHKQMTTTPQNRHTKITAMSQTKQRQTTTTQNKQIQRKTTPNTVNTSFTVKVTTTTTTTPKPTEPSTKATAKPDTTTTRKTSPKPESRTTTPQGKDKDKGTNVDEDKGRGGGRQYCEMEKHMGLVWPRTRQGRIAEQQCPKGLIGKATWRCVRRGWHPAGPDKSDCLSSWMIKLDEEFQRAMEGRIPAEAEQAAIHLQEAVETKVMMPGDLKRTAMKFLPKLKQSLLKNYPGESKPHRKRHIKKIKEAFLRTSSQLLSKRQVQGWRSLSRKDCHQAATSLVLAIEDTGFQAALLMDAGSSDIIVDNNIVMEVNVVNTEDRLQDAEFPSPKHLVDTLWQGEVDRITIPRMNLEFAERQGLVNVVFTLYKNMGELVEPDSSGTSSDDPTSSNYNAGTISADSSDESSSVVINTYIISASINSAETKWKLPEPIRFTLHHLKQIENPTPQCSFWDIDSSSLTGSWSQEGCRVIETNSSQTTCECDHLTNFAVLMDVSGLVMDVEHAFALHIITYIGCVISIVCLILAWITFMVFKNLQCDRNTIHKNLVLCLLLAEVVFLAGIGQTEYKLVCSIIAGVLHYLFLGAFAWMCLEGVQLYVMLVEVFELEKSRIKWYYLFGYGLPLIIVGITSAIRHEGYGTDAHCWMSTEHYFVWSFVGPALAVVLINVGMLSIAIYTMCRHSNISTTMKERNKVHKFSVSESYCNMETYASPKLRFPELPAWLKGAVVLVVLLGLTWGIGVLYLTQGTIVMAYVFTILNSLQGFFIYTFHCLMNEKVQKEYRKVARRTTWLPDCIRVNYGGYAMTSSSQNNSSGSGNIFSKLLGNKKRKPSTTNSSMKPFLNQDQHRRSSSENSSSRDSSTIPTSLNGYVYKPHYTDDPNRPFSNNNGCNKISINGHGPLEPCYESVDGLAGELSECIDCSVVDSEMVTEYCNNNMKVNQERRRYSTGSENSDYERPQLLTRLETPMVEADGLSNLSCNSSKKPLSSFVSTSEVATGSNLDLSEEEPEEDEKSLNFHLERYIIPTRPQNPESDSMDNKSSSMNKLSKANQSLSSIPEADPSQQHHASSPNIQFRPGFCAPVASLPNHMLLMNHGYEESNSDNCASPSSEVSSPSSVKSSLPNLSFHTNNPHADADYDLSRQDTLEKRRPTSEADMNFSTFRMPNSASDC